jgi:hypothetical protein
MECYQSRQDNAYSIDSHYHALLIRRLVTYKGAKRLLNVRNPQQAFEVPIRTDLILLVFWLCYHVICYVYNHSDER